MLNFSRNLCIEYLCIIVFNIKHIEVFYVMCYMHVPFCSFMNTLCAKPFFPLDECLCLAAIISLKLIYVNAETKYLYLPHMRTQLCSKMYFVPKTYHLEFASLNQKNLDRLMFLKSRFKTVIPAKYQSNLKLLLHLFSIL